jgi:hypothetical protein
MAIISFRVAKPLGCEVVRSWGFEPARVQLEKVWREMGLLETA